MKVKMAITSLKNTDLCVFRLIYAYGYTLIGYLNYNQWETVITNNKKEKYDGTN